MKCSAQMPKFLKNLDMFGGLVPNLNIGGEHKIKTSIGSLMSISIMFILTLFGIMKLQHWMMRKNPSVVTVQDENGLEESFKLNTGEGDWMVAATASHWRYGARIDTQYV